MTPETAHSRHTDYGTLSWVRDDLHRALAQAREALTAFAQQQEPAARIQECIHALHLVGATLHLLEIQGGAALAEEMEQVATALSSGATRDAAATAALLGEAIDQLPVYLEILEQGRADTPAVLTPLLNELREARGAAPLSETTYFDPRLEVAPPAPQAAAKHPAIQAYARKLRPVFQSALLAWLKDRQHPAALKKLAVVLQTLQEGCATPAAVRSWWIMRALLEALQTPGWTAPERLVRVVSRMDGEIKRLIAHGETVFSTEPPAQILKQCLYYLGLSQARGPLVDAVRQAFHLEQLMPPAFALDRAAREQRRQGAQMSQQALVALQQDLAAVNAGLERVAREPHSGAADLNTTIEILRRSADTLSLLGYRDGTGVLQDQAARLRAISQGGRTITADSLLEIATALVYVEEMLDGLDVTPEHQRREAEAMPAALSPHHAPTPGQPPLLSEHDLVQIRRHVITETLTTLGEIKAALSAYAQEPEHSELVAVTPELVAQIEGALAMLSLERAAALMVGVGAFIRQGLLQAPQAPWREQLDTLADAITSIEYYLETLAQGRARADAILTVAEISLEQLGCAPLAEAGTAPAPTRTADAITPAPEAETWAVFRAEAEEILHKTEALLEGWTREPDNPSYAGRLQQYLHTLKGAARMADATPIADLAHEMESLLVRLRGRPLDATAGQAALLQQCQDWIAQALYASAPDGLHAPEPLLAALAGTPLPPMPATTPAIPASAAPAREVNDDLHEIIDFIEGLTFDPTAGQHKTTTAQPAGEEHVRIQAALLDELSLLAGAVGGEHAHLVGQLGALSAAVGSLAQAGPEQVGGIAQELEIDISRLATACARQGELLGQLHETLRQASRVAYASVASRLRRTVRQACNDMRKYAELEITGGELQIDRAQLNHLLPVIEHLLRNAVAHGIEAPEWRKAHGKSPVGKIRLHFRQEVGNNTIQLGDDGAGIDLEAVRARAEQQGLPVAVANLSEQELLQLILLPGFSTAASISQIAGRGLGLAAASSELRELGGDLMIDNHPGAGVLFTLRFPTRVAATAAGRAGAPGQRQASVLIVDDSATVRKVTANLLQAQRYHTLVAHDGVSALHLLEHTTPDAILLDVEMPGMDGFTLAQALKADARLATIPIIMITSRTDEQYRRRAQELGIVSYMGKPFQEAALLATLRQHIGAHA